MLKKLPVGVEFFDIFSQEDFYYVDKTDFIAELLKDKGMVNLFTRPRRFGKTLTMSMLKCFFEVGSDKSLFAGLKIVQERKLCEEHMGKYPVIFITLKSVDGLKLENAYAALRMLIGMEANRFSYLLESSALDPNEKNIYRSLIHVDKGMYDMADALLVNSLRILSQLLSKHYGRKTILLIDEYDVPLDKAFKNGYYDEMVDLIRNLLGNVLKTNPDLQFAVLTGCLRISKESIFTGLNNLKVNTFTDNKFNEYFGFTDSEVDEMLSYYDLISKKEEVREWYDGFRFGNKNIYCPWDVINYCSDLYADPDAFPKNYWANTSGNDLVRRFIDKADNETRADIERLIAGKTVLKEIKQELTYRDLDTSIDNLWSVLFTIGYLTYTEFIPSRQFCLTIPNEEIRDLFVTQVKEWFSKASRADMSRVGTFCDAFPKGEAALIEKMLNEYLWESISIRDTAVRKERKENFYHGLVMGLLRCRSDWSLKSNPEMGLGYSDICLVTSERTGVIIEFKYAEDGNLEKACEEALAQIDVKKYAEELSVRRMKKILKYGMAFYKKDCMVVLDDN